MRPPFPSVIDSSMIAAFRSCPQKWSLEYLNHWKPQTPSVHLRAGGAYAHGLEAARTAYYVRGEPLVDAEARGIKACIEFYGDFECPPDSAKSLERTAGALEFYFSRYSFESDQASPIHLPSPDKPRGIELGFNEPIDLDDHEMTHPVTGDPLLYCGRADMAVDYQGMRLGVDDKTATQLGATWSRQWDLRCFSDDHEVFTHKGWVKISQVHEGEHILQSDAEGNLSFAAITDFIASSYAGPMISIEGRRLSQFVTPNHRVLLQRRRGGQMTVFAEALAKRDEHDGIPLAGRHKEERLDPDHQRLLVAVQADAKLQASKGSVSAGRGHREHMPHRAIVFAFAKHRKATRLKELFARLGLQVEEKRRGELYEFYVSGFEAVAELVDTVLDEKKNFKPGYETLFDDAFLDELEYWDGWGKQYYTNSKNNAEFVATVAALNDRAASVSCDIAGHYTVVLSHDVIRKLKSSVVKSVPFVGHVFCVTVPSGYLLTRLEGNISISGNSQFTGYSWGLAKQDIPLAGWLVRGVSILKTKYDTLEAITYRPQWQIDRWHAQLKRDIRRMKAAWSEGVFDYSLDHACTEYGGCPFRQACLMIDPLPLLEQQFDRRAWDPVRRIEVPMEVIDDTLVEAPCDGSDPQSKPTDPEGREI